MGSLLAGLLVALENSLITESRFILTDSLLLDFGFLTVLFYLIYRQRISNKISDHRFEAYGFVFTSALCAASTASIKWTGLAFLLFIMVLEGYRLWTENVIGRMKQSLAALSFKYIYFILTYVFILGIVYVSVFAIHFSLLPRSGPGDPFMSPWFQKTLVGSAYANDSQIIPETFWSKFVELNTEMYLANATLKATAPYSSKWYTWPFMIRPVFYWQVAGQNYIYLLGNPLIYWLGTASIIAVIFGLFLKLFLKVTLEPKLKPNTIDLRQRKTDKKLETGIFFFLVCGYLVNFLPFMFIGRVMFLYHYQAALVFSILAIAYIFDRQKISDAWRLRIFIIIVGLCLLSFLYFSPLTYGTHLDDSQLWARMWLSTWR